MAREDGIGLLGQLLPAGEIAAVTHVDVSQETVRCLLCQGFQVLQPGLGRGGGRSGLDVGEQGHVLAQGLAAAKERKALFI